MNVLRSGLHNIRFFGFQPSSLVDYPGKVAAVLFLKGCNLDCSYCHNRVVMHQTDEMTIDDMAPVIRRLASQKLTEGIVITGGEPTVYGESLVDLIRHLREAMPGKSIKLDTNGTDSRLIKKIIDEGLVNFVAMDVKLPYDKYGRLGYTGEAAEIERSVAVIKRSGIPHHFRYTKFDGVEREEEDWIMTNFPGIKVQELKRTRN